MMRRPSARAAALLAAAILVLSLIAAAQDEGAGASSAPAAPDPAALAAGLAGAAGRFVEAAEAGLTCYPARMSSAERRWTFFVRGGRAVQVTGAQLEVGGRSLPAVRVDAPTPHAVLIDFEYEPLAAGETAGLVLEGAAGEIARFPISVVPPAEVPPEYRQRHLVRVQTKPWTLDYPLQRGSATEARRLAEIGGDEQFLALLSELGIERVRKSLPRFAEGDTVQWFAQLNREEVISARYLRQYLVYIDEGRSEDAYKEIFLAFPQVEAAFINTDREKLLEDTGSAFTPEEKAAPIPEGSRGPSPEPR
ncbi:MAG: hypothetical protein FJY75_11800 [Candidatus Eisenbacteria bacterium]|uniref:Uncharacterized protein n=1 Tax=Eiseniibacteriota bacterium TaxID=2212470 RepID=A0A938BRP1_UNCEI|nr:hypothetical protein [Candidatus Eisenbacteria bacterium]